MIEKNTLQSDALYRNWFFFLFLYLIVELGRPQFFLPIAPLRPGLLVILLLIYSLLSSGRIGEVIFYRQMKYVVVFVLLLILYIPFARNNFRAYQVAYAMVLVLPVLLSIIVVINNQDRIIGLFKIFSGLLIFLATFSLVNNGIGPGGTIGDENDLCLFLVSFLPMLFFLLDQAKSIKGKIILLGAIFLTFLSVVATMSRGGFVGLVAMASVYWWFSKKKMILLVGGVLIGIIMIIAGGSEYEREMSSIADINENTASHRLLSWGAAWRMFLDMPLGVGGGNFPVHFSEYQTAGFRHDMWGRAAHSLWFTLIPETGFIGIYIYFVIILKNFRDLFVLRHLDFEEEINRVFFHKLSIALLASFSGFFASATFISVLYYPVFWYLTAIVIAARRVAYRY